MSALPQVIFVTGTDTGVGKTIATAALAVALRARGRSVAVYKPTQAGLEDGAGDIDVVRRLAGIDEAHEGVRLLYPMAPVAAAERERVALPDAGAHLAAIDRLAADHDHTVVEGAGGVLVQLDATGVTLADIAARTTRRTRSVGALVVCRAALGTLNHTELTVEALTRRGVPVTGLVIGSWPAAPTEIDLSNRRYLDAHAVPLLAAIPERAGGLKPAEFQAAAPGWFPPARLVQDTAPTATG